MGSNQSQIQIDSKAPLTKPHVFFLLGGPGSGKDTQAESLMRDYKLKHLSTGQLLRLQQQKGGELAETIETYMKEGKLLPSSLVVDLLEQAISTYGNRRYVINGFPRNRENWQEFEKRLAGKVVIRNLIYLDCPTQTLTQRMTERGKISGRPDDNLQVIPKRISTFENQTLPVIKRFQQFDNCLRVDASQPREKVYEDLKNKLTQQSVFPPKPAEMIFVLGGPGSGKGTQCSILVKKYNFIHISTGDLLRDQIKSGSPLGKEIHEVIKEGKLVSSDLMVRLVQENIEKNNYAGKYLLDGFPRGQENMDVWERVMSKWIDLKSVVYFDCTLDELKKRLIERGKTSGRADDCEEAIVKRLNIFDDYTKPVVTFYDKASKLNRFNANRQIASITHDLEAHLESLEIYPNHV